MEYKCRLYNENYTNLKNGPVVEIAKVPAVGDEIEVAFIDEDELGLEGNMIVSKVVILPKGADKNGCQFWVEVE